MHFYCNENLPTLNIYLSLFGGGGMGGKGSNPGEIEGRRGTTILSSFMFYLTYRNRRNNIKYFCGKWQIFYTRGYKIM